jgi:hypothetical protein
MNKIIPPHLLLAAFVSASVHLQAQIPISIDFESPDYFIGMSGGDYPTPGDYPSPWFKVDSGTSITDVNPISGTQSMLIQESEGAGLWFTIPESYTSLTISADIRPHHVHNGFNNYVSAGGLALYSDDSPDPRFGGSVRLAEIYFQTAGWSTHTLDLYGGIGATTVGDTGVDWISDATYTLTYELDLVAGTMTATVQNGTSTIWTTSGALSDANATRFRLDFRPVPSSSGEKALVDNISIAGIQEPSISITRDADPQEIVISFIGAIQKSSDLGVSDPWTDLEPQPSSPWTFTPSEGKMFYRIKPSE